MSLVKEAREKTATLFSEVECCARSAPVDAVNAASPAPERNAERSNNGSKFVMLINATDKPMTVFPTITNFFLPCLSESAPKGTLSKTELTPSIEKNKPENVAGSFFTPVKK